MKRTTSSVLDSIPDRGSQPESPDLLRLVGGPPNEYASTACECHAHHQRTAERLSTGVDRSEVVSYADAHLTDVDRCTDLLLLWQSLLALLFAGELVLADQHCARLLAQPRSADSCSAVAVARIIRSRIDFVAGDPCGACRALDELTRTPGSSSLDAVVVGWLAEALVEVGEAHGAERLLIGRGYSGTLPTDLPGKAFLLHARATVNLSLGRLNAARRDFLAAGVEAAHCGSANPALLPWRTGLIPCLHGLGQLGLARKLACAEFSAASQWGAPREIGRVLLAGAQLESGVRARELFSEAVDLLAISNALGDLARAANMFGTIRGLADDVPWARRMLRRIAALTQRGENRHAAGRATEKLAEFLSVHGDPVLTKQENAVARLVWAGYNNAEIADHLSLTRRTVEHHLSSIYRKLQLPDRRRLFLAMSEPI